MGTISRQDIEQKKINMVVVKDTSRLGQYTLNGHIFFNHEYYEHIF